MYLLRRQKFTSKIAGANDQDRLSSGRQLTQTELDNLGVLAKDVDVSHHRKAFRAYGSRW